MKPKLKQIYPWDKNKRINTYEIEKKTCTEATNPWSQDKPDILYFPFRHSLTHGVEYPEADVLVCLCLGVVSGQVEIGRGVAGQLEAGHQDARREHQQDALRQQPPRPVLGADAVQPHHAQVTHQLLQKLAWRGYNEGLVIRFISFLFLE